MCSTYCIRLGQQTGDVNTDTNILNFVAVFEIFKFLITNVIRDVTLPHRAPPIL